MNEDIIYLLKTDDIINNEYVYKIGRSKRPDLKRLTEYPKTYKIIITRSCIDCIYIENKLIKLFNKKYKKAYKNEYFIGSGNEMIHDINKIIDDEYSASLINKSIIVPEITSDIDTSNCHFTEYINQCIEITTNPKDIISAKTLWEHFKKWFGDFHTAYKLPKLVEFTNFMTENLCRKTLKGYKCIKIRNEDDEDETIVINDLDADTDETIVIKELDTITDETIVINELDTITDKTIVINELELIIIKSGITDTGKKIYYITDQKHNILHKIFNIKHMEWILSNVWIDCNCCDIFENILYDINDEQFINTLFYDYTKFIGMMLNKDSNNNIIYNYINILCEENKYIHLSITSKIIYLFEADTCIDNLEGRYYVYDNNLYLFSAYTLKSYNIEPLSLYTIMHDDDDDSLLYNFFDVLGKIIYEELNFNIIYYDCFLEDVLKSIEHNNSTKLHNSTYDSSSSDEDNIIQNTKLLNVINYNNSTKLHDSTYDSSSSDEDNIIQTIEIINDLDSLD